MIIVSYPNNPVTAKAPLSFYEKLVWWAKKYDVAVVHDNAYSELVMDGEPGISFLSVPGAMEVGIEFNSLSKSYNLTGLRISFAMGNHDIIRNFRRIRSQIDYGISLPVQIAAIAALDGPQDILDRNRAKYRERRDALCGGLRAVGWDVPNSPSTMFVWARLPDAYHDSYEFVLELMDRTGVVCVPGGSFGAEGEGFVRFALVRDVPVLEQAAALIGKSGMI
jgi:LL-diaminopimelate aminotransferase